MSRRRNGQDQDVEETEGSPAATDEAPPETSATAPANEASGLEPAPEGEPQDEVAVLRREVAELKDTLLRRRADFDNYRKRVERDRTAAATDAEAALLRKVLGTVDNLERALAAQDTGAEALREGVALTHRELLAMLESLGVEPLQPLGQRFDPAEHQAILHEPAQGYEPGTVAEVFRKGFKYRERLLRPALVKVASESGSENGDMEVQ
jgi:molecular chaperone GrpE